MDSRDLVDTKELIHVMQCDGACEFEDEESIPVNRSLLAIYSELFRQEFFEPEPRTQIKIKGFDRASFKTFLNCLFGLKEYTLHDALSIFPIAHRYEVKESLEKCTAVLAPEEMSDAVCRILNLSAFYKVDELSNSVISFIKNKYGVVNFLENKRFRSLLEPSAVVKIIENVDLSSFVWSLVHSWADHYLQERNKSGVKSFFQEIGIFDKIRFSHFESAKALMNFHARTNKKLFSSDEILCHLEANSLKPYQTLSNTSTWMKIIPGQCITENIKFSDLFFSRRQCENSEPNLRVYVTTNKILVEPENSIADALEVKARCIFRKLKVFPSANVSSRPLWRDDLNFFYVESEPQSFNYLFSHFSQSNEIVPNCQMADCKESIYQFCIKYRCDIEIHSLEMQYKFNFPCRILKISLDTCKNLSDGNHLNYFTRKISVKNGY